MLASAPFFIKIVLLHEMNRAGFEQSSIQTDEDKLFGNPFIMRDSECSLTGNKITERHAITVGMQKAAFCFFLVIQLVVMITRPLSDPSECRYGNLAANMAATGNFIEPKFIYQGVMQCFEGKPPLFFQAGGVSCLLFGKSAFAVRFPSFVCSLLTVWFVYWFVRRAGNRKTAWTAVLLCYLNPMFYVFSGLCLTDMMLTTCIVGGVAAYAGFSLETRRQSSKWCSILFFASLAIGMLVKGPVAIVSIGLPVLMFVAITGKWNKLRNHAWIRGSLVLAALALPWYVMMCRINPDFLHYFLYNENFARFFLKDYGDKFGSGHDSFRGVAFFIALVANLPALLPLLMLALSSRLRLQGTQKKTMELMALIAALALTAFWCPTNRVPFSYLLPTIPFFAIFAALKIAESEYLNEERMTRLSFRVSLVLGTITAGALVVTTIGAGRLTDKMPAAFYRSVLEQEAALDQAGNPLFYFVGRTPFSAEFYLGDHVYNHSNEEFAESLTNSIPYILLITDRNLKKLTKPLDRELILKRDRWNMYAPGKEQQPSPLTCGSGDRFVSRLVEGSREKLGRLRDCEVTVAPTVYVLDATTKKEIQ